MSPFSLGQKLQIAELRSPSQVIDFEMRKCRVGIISMNYEDAVYQHAKGAKDIIDEFKRFGGRFYIKNIPQKTISNAQKFEPDLPRLKL